MILSLAAYKNHLPPNTITDSTKFDAFEIRALYNFFPKFLGLDIVNKIATGQYDDDDLLKNVTPALANTTYLLSIPFFNLVLTASGFGIVNNPNISPASAERIRDLKDACLQAANMGIDTLLAYLEANVSTYTTWNQCSLNNDSLIEDAAAFSAAIGFIVPRNTFVDLIEHIGRVEKTTFADLFSSEFITEMVTSVDTLVRPLMVKALANYAWHSFKEVPAFFGYASKYAEKAIALLRANIASYPTYSEYGYEAPYENSDDEAEEGGFFIGGLTA
jgi:hypothetical protein